MLVIQDLFDLVGKLRTELSKMREEMERARDEWKQQRGEMEREKLAAEQKARAEATAAEQTASGLRDRLEATMMMMTIKAIFRRAQGQWDCALVQPSATFPHHPAIHTLAVTSAAQHAATCARL